MKSEDLDMRVDEMAVRAFYRELAIGPDPYISLHAASMPLLARLMNSSHAELQASRLEFEALGSAIELAAAREDFVSGVESHYDDAPAYVARFRRDGARCLEAAKQLASMRPMAVDPDARPLGVYSEMADTLYKAS